MTSRSYRNCVEVMKAVVSDGYINQISLVHLEKYIKVVCGADPRTLQNYLKNLQDFEFLTVARVESNLRKPGIFDVNLTRIPDYKQLRIDQIVERVKV